MFTPEIIFEDQSMLVINKPPGLVVNRARSVKVSTLQDWIEQYLQQDDNYQHGLQSDETFAQRSGMVHRLDKDTSGVMLWAKTPEAMYELMRQFKSRQVHKTYWALVHGQVEPPKGIVKVGITRHPKDRERFSVSAQGKPSETFYQVLNYFPDFKSDLPVETSLPDKKETRHIYHGFSLVALQPKTGRTHQIRVHMKFLHHPLVGDERYSGRKRGRADEKWCPRQWLHAQQIEFTHPATQQKQVFKADLAPDLVRTLDLLDEHGVTETE